MEVDLTDDDITVTCSTVAPKVTPTQKSGPKSTQKLTQKPTQKPAPKPSPALIKSKTTSKALTPGSSQAAATYAQKAKQSTTSDVETVEIISDDEDIIFEDTSSKNKSQPQGKTPSSSVPRNSSPIISISVSQSKEVPRTDAIEVDDDIEVLAQEPMAEESKKGSRVSETVSNKSNIQPRSNSKTRSKEDRMEVDDMIEVVEISQPPSQDKLENSDPKTLSKSAPVQSKSGSSGNFKSSSVQSDISKSKTSDAQKSPLPASVQSDTSKDMQCDVSKDGISVAHRVSKSRSPPVSVSKGTTKSSDKTAADSDDVIEVVEPAATASAKHASTVSISKTFVVDISEDDDECKKRDSHGEKKLENKCLNASCNYGKDLASAPMFVVSYYGCKILKGKYEVCQECFDDAISHHQKLTEMLIDQKSLFSYDNFPLNDITVVDLDSDEEIDLQEPPLPFSVLQDVEENLESVLKQTLSKIDLDYQIGEATAYLSEKITSLELTGKEMDDEYDQLQKKIDEMRRQVYKSHEPIIKELPSIDMNPMPPVFKPPLPAMPQAIKIEQSPPFGYRGVAMKKVTPISPSRSVSSRSDGSSQDVVALEQIKSPNEAPPLPPIGPLVRPKPRANDIVYVMKMSFFGVWLKGRVNEVITNTASGAPLVQTLYKVKMEILGSRKQYSIKTVSGRHMAYPNPAQVRLPVGTRVIAVFQDDESGNQNKGGSYYSGLIAEPPKSNNRYRYLVFFDDGYAQYVNHNKILVVCESSLKVWDDIHPDSREFIRTYLQNYPERPMVKLGPNQVVKTEWNGKWWIARVVEVDGSLVKMSFDADKRTEWIYRGSTRLAPLYTELAQRQARQESGVSGTISRMRGMGMRRVNQPYVEYTQNIGIEDDTNETPAPTTVRAVAKKSTSKRQEVPASPIQPARPGFFNPENIGVVKELQLPKDAAMPKRFQSHKCGPQCIDWIEYDPVKMRGYNPLSIPLYCGWQRELPKFKKKSTIMYTAPCGRRLRNMEELHKYLRLCQSNMAVDLFDFDYWVNALSEFALSDRVPKYIERDDMTNGKENVPIPLVNYIDHSLPTYLAYKTQREPYEEVRLNLDEEFLCGCDCTDDCLNKDTCACWQLTIQGSSLYPGGVPDPNVGYYYKRLQERVITGIYECNPQCKCSKTTCLNRVVQHPLQLKLQLFKTPNKGWGLRCINDIPKGTFICIYAGYLYTEQKANEIGNQDGDAYLAELDYIEVVERMKEDYESDVEDDEEDALVDELPSQLKFGKDDDKRNSKTKNKDETDADFKIGWRSSSDNNSDDTIRSRLRKRTAGDLDSSDGEKGTRRKDNPDEDDGSDDDKLERLPSSFTPKPLKKPQIVAEKPVNRFQSVRKFYGPNEHVYIMDANKVGNIGRYLNHSCCPNVFVQNVFVDTHDLRFPWVAFFALTYIKAGTELTWDYNYEVGSVPDKQIICQCGSIECRGRLL